MNNIINFNRFGLLVKRELIFKKSFLLTSLLGVMIAMFGITLIAISTDRNYRYWNDESYAVLFIILFSVFGILYSGTSFPYFRNKKRSLDYLLVPNSTIEKYSFEVLFRIILFIVIYPVLFWITANLAAFTINSITTVNYDIVYKFWSPLKLLIDGVEMTEGVFAILSLIVFLISIPFTGAAYFSKNPLFKTAIFLAVLIGSSLFYGWILDQIINFTSSHGFDPEMSPETGLILLSVFIWISTLVLHTSAFYRLKEKEV